MKKIQRFLRGTALLAVLSLLVSATAFAASVPDPTSDFYVNDYVGVLSGDTKSDIVSKNDGLYNATGAQIVVTVVQDTGGVSMEQYAYDMANAWGIGSAEKNNGVLLLLSVGDDDYQCIQGSGLETLLPTSTLSRILQEDLEPDFADKNYDAGVKKTFASLYDAVSSIYGYDGSTGGAANPSPVPQPDYDYGYGYGYDDGYRDDGDFRFRTIPLRLGLSAVFCSSVLFVKYQRHFIGNNFCFSRLTVTHFFVKTAIHLFL